MAVIRQSPKCLKCGGLINGKYLDQSDLPAIQQIIGDTFIGWDYENHKCEQLQMENYRLNGLTRRSEELAQQLKEEGLMGCDLEVIGALLLIKYKGEDNRLDKLFEGTSDLLKRAQELLDKLENKTE